MNICDPLKKVFSTIVDLIPDEILLKGYHDQHLVSQDKLNAAKCGILRNISLVNASEGAFLVEPKIEGEEKDLFIELFTLETEESGAELVYQYAKKGKVYNLDEMKVTGTLAANSTGTALVDNALAARDAANAAIEEFRDTHFRSEAAPSEDEPGPK